MDIDIAFMFFLCKNAENIITRKLLIFQSELISRGRKYLINKEN